MGAMASQITSLTIVYSTVYSGANQRKQQSSASLASVLGIHRWPVNSPHKGPVAQKCFYLMTSSWHQNWNHQHWSHMTFGEYRPDSTVLLVVSEHDDVIKWKHFPRYSTGHRWIPLTKPVTRNYDVFSVWYLNKRLSKQPRWRFETPSRSSWRHCNETTGIWVKDWWIAASRTQSGRGDDPGLITKYDIKYWWFQFHGWCENMQWRRR